LDDGYVAADEVLYCETGGRGGSCEKDVVVVAGEANGA
jgi:hypothetical protein